MPQAPAYRRILVGVDFSSGSREAFRHAVALARALGARLEVAYVVPRLKPAVPFSETNRKVVANLQREEEARAREQLDRLAGTARNLEVTARVLRGTPSKALLAHARRRSADLIVVAQRGQNLAESLLIGSTAERVARKAEVPVVLVPVGGR